MKILVLATYPIRAPSHGGQIRVRSLVDYYRAAGHEVVVAGVLGSDAYGAEVGFLPYPAGEIKRVFENTFLVEDYCIGKLYSDDKELFERLCSKIIVRPDLVHVEQPWLFGFACRLVREIYAGVPLVYGSQNIEYLLKKQILKNYRADELVGSATVAIEAMEREALLNSEAVIAVSDADAAWILEQYPDCQVFVAPNGVSERQLPVSHEEIFEKYVAGKKRFALYCASAHPPNVDGFFDLFSEGFGSLKPDESLVVVGSAGMAIAGNDLVFKSAKLADRITVAGVVEEDVLAALIHHAHCLILPLTHGGGTNLKTAEALLSGKHVVATPVAMRGFDSYISAQGVHVCDGGSAFKRKLREVMELPPLCLDAAQMEERRQVMWSSCLKPLDGLLEQFARGAS